MVFLLSGNQMLRGMDRWTFGGADAFIASTWFGLRHARLKVVVLQRTVVSRFGCFVLRSLFSKVVGASFLSPGCTVFEFSVLHFRDLGASCFGLRFRVLRFRNYRGETLQGFHIIKRQ